MLYDPTWEEKIQTPVLNEPWRELLRSAAKIIEEKGWCQHRMEVPDGRVCTLGAMLKVHGSTAAILEADRMLTQHTGFLTVPKWNDFCGRTKEEVLQTLLYVANT